MGKVVDVERLTTRQVAEYWQVTTRSVRRWVALGLLKAYRAPGAVGGPLRFRREDVESLFKAVRRAGDVR